MCEVICIKLRNFRLAVYYVYIKSNLKSHLEELSGLHRPTAGYRLFFIAPSPLPPPPPCRMTLEDIKMTGLVRVKIEMTL